MKTFKNAMGKVPPPLIFITFVLAILMVTVGPVSAAPNCDSDGDGYDKISGKWCIGNPDYTDYQSDPDDSNPCDPNPDADACENSGGGGGGGGSTSPDPYNLARASFATREELGNPLGGVFADPKPECQGYNYWDWQEALLPVGVGLDCPTYLNSSNVSGGGRWFLISSPAGSEEVLDVIERWLVVDFSQPFDPATYSPCYNLDNYLYLKDPDQIVENSDPCIDNLAIRLSADRILKARANQQQLEFSIRHRPDPAASIYWPPWGYVSYIHPLYLWDQSATLPNGWTGCRVMSTRKAPGENHDRAEAELLRELGPGTTEVLGTYYLPLEVCVERASD